MMSYLFGEWGFMRFILCCCNFLEWYNDFFFKMIVNYECGLENIYNLVGVM